jgi:rhodanese-related sulfurtransferase
MGEKMSEKITSGQAYEMYKSDTEHTYIIDVRTRAEYVFIGHPAMAYNIPYHFWTSSKDEKSGYKDNAHFVADCQEKFKKEDKILIICRSGNRSATACKLLEDAGFTNVYDVSDGFEGDKVKDKNSIYYGKRCVNGWKHDGLPWSYDIDEALAYNKVSENK